MYAKLCLYLNELFLLFRSFLFRLLSASFLRRSVGCRKRRIKPGERGRMSGLDNSSWRSDSRHHLASLLLFFFFCKHLHLCSLQNPLQAHFSLLTCRLPFYSLFFFLATHTCTRTCTRVTCKCNLPCFLALPVSRPAAVLPLLKSVLCECLHSGKVTVPLFSHRFQTGVPTSYSAASRRPEAHSSNALKFVQ